MNLNRYNKNVTLEWNEKTFLLYIAWSPAALLSQISWLKFEPWSQILFETKYEKKTKRYYLCYNVSGNFFKLSKIKR